MDVGPAGFNSAPVTKALLLVTAGSSLLLQGPRSSWPSGSQFAPLIEPFVFKHLGELAFGSYLFYHFRILERQRGPESFAAQAIAVLSLQHLAHWAVTSLTDWHVQLGPYALLASSFVSFFKDVPMLQNLKIVGIPVTDKAIVYAAGAQLLTSAGRTSFPSFVVGATVGLAFQCNLFGCRGLKVPNIVSKVLGRTVGALLGGNRPRHRVIVTGNPGDAAQNPPQQAPAEVSAEALEQLVAMGFEEARARSALQQSRNDVQAALSRLL